MTVAERFWVKVARGDGCWEWTGSRDDRGYGRFRLDGRNRRAHRVRWELDFGPIPVGLCVLHVCDNPSCVRHLYLGTLRDNMRDMVERGRTPDHSGERNGRSKLTDHQVREIRQQASGASGVELARAYGVTPTMIGYIVNGHRWKGV